MCPDHVLDSHSRAFSKAVAEFKWNVAARRQLNNQKKKPGAKLKKWRYRQPLYADAVGTVEAPTKAQAEEEALQDMRLSVCHYCSRRIEICGESEANMSIVECSETKDL
jgi:hypothetical protein